jgi:hypothetical protein
MIIVLIEVLKFVAYKLSQIMSPQCPSRAKMCKSGSVEGLYVEAITIDEN